MFNLWQPLGLKHQPLENVNFKMVPVRWGNAVRLKPSTHPQLAARLRSPFASRSFLRPRTAIPNIHSGRVPLAQSRALHVLQKARTRHGNTEGLKPAVFSAHGSLKSPTILQSAFPTKTAIFVVLLGTLVYFLTEIREEDWTDEVINSYVSDQNQATPLHFFENREELDHWIQFHIPDASGP